MTEWKVVTDPTEFAELDPETWERLDRSETGRAYGKLHYSPGRDLSPRAVTGGWMPVALFFKEHPSTSELQQLMKPDPGSSFMRRNQASLGVYRRPINGCGLATTFVARHLRPA